MSMKMIQKTIIIAGKSKGFQLIDEEIEHALVPDIADISTGILHIFLKHTSASLALGENYEKEVRDDIESFLMMW